MIYFIVTTSIFNNCEIRKSQYIKCINKLKTILIDNHTQDYKIIIVENNGERNTFLDELCDSNCTLYYTNNNSLQTNNKGLKELQDILDCINHFNIDSSDFIVKMTGRYFLNSDSEFMNIIKHINNTNFECVIKFGSYMKPVDYQMENCITGLIGMRCYYIKQIEIPNENECIEWKWGKVTYIMNYEDIYTVRKLGIRICPGSNNYFDV